MTKPLTFGWGDGTPDTPADSGEEVEHTYAESGMYTISVSGADASTAECQVTVDVPEPPEPEQCSITSIAPQSTQPDDCWNLGQEVTITGTGFSKVTKVEFDTFATNPAKINAQQIVSQSATQIVIQMPTVITEPPGDEPRGVNNLALKIIRVIGDSTCTLDVTGNCIKYGSIN